MSNVADKVAFGLNKVSQALRTNERDSAYKEELTPTQAEILSILLRNDEGCQVQIKDVAFELGVTMPTAVEAISALCRKGLIKKTPSQEDKRARLLALLPKGRDVAKEVVTWTHFLEKAVDVLEPAEQSVMLKGMMKIILQLQKQKKVSVANMCITCKYFQAFAHKDSVNPHHCQYVDAPFGDLALRVLCPDYDCSKDDVQEQRWLKNG